MKNVTCALRHSKYEPPFLPVDTFDVSILDTVTDAAPVAQQLVNARRPDMDVIKALPEKLTASPSSRVLLA